MTTISLKLPESLLRQVEQEATVRGVSKSAIIRDSLARTLPRKSRRPKKVTCLDLVRDLVGVFKGPADASINARYLDEAILADHPRAKKSTG